MIQVRKTILSIIGMCPWFSCLLKVLNSSVFLNPSRFPSWEGCRGVFPSSLLKNRTVPFSFPFLAFRNSFSASEMHPIDKQSSESARNSFLEISRSWNINVFILFLSPHDELNQRCGQYLYKTKTGLIRIRWIFLLCQFFYYMLRKIFVYFIMP